MKLLQFQEDAYIVTTTNHEIYEGIPTSSPISSSAIGSPPTVAYRCRVKVTASGTHTDCAGNLTIGSDTLTFSATGQIKICTTIITASTKPAISFTGLDCNILIECLDVGGAEIKTETATATKIQFENTSSGFYNSEGKWTVYSGSYAMCKDAATVGSILRYNSLDHTIEKVDVERYFNKIIYYIFYL